MKFDTGRMGLWPGGLLEVHGESFFGNTSVRLIAGLTETTRRVALAPSGAGDGAVRDAGDGSPVSPGSEAPAVVGDGGDADCVGGAGDADF